MFWARGADRRVGRTGYIRAEMLRALRPPHLHVRHPDRPPWRHSCWFDRVSLLLPPLGGRDAAAREGRPKRTICPQNRQCQVALGKLEPIAPGRGAQGGAGSRPV